MHPTQRVTAFIATVNVQYPSKQKQGSMAAENILHRIKAHNFVDIVNLTGAVYCPPYMYNYIHMISSLSLPDIRLHYWLSFKNSPS